MIISVYIVWWKDVPGTWNIYGIYNTASHAYAARSAIKGQHGYRKVKVEGWVVQP